MKRISPGLLSLIIAGLLLTACGQKAAVSGLPEDIRRYELKGKVVELDKERNRAKLDHEEVEDFMSPMTMWFVVKDELNFNKLAVGDQVTATLVYNTEDNRSWLESLTVSKASAIGGTGS